MLSAQRLRRGQKLAGPSSAERLGWTSQRWPLSETKGEDVSSPFVCSSHRTNTDDLLQAFSSCEAGETVTIRPLCRNELQEAWVTREERGK